MRSLFIPSLAALALATAGCAGGYSASYRTSPGYASAQEIESLERVASRQMGCPEHALTTRPIDDRIWQVSGCGQTRELARVDRGDGYTEWQAIAPVGAYASNELRCPLDAIVVHAPAENVRSVTGCGQQATYELACADDARQCGWSITERYVEPQARGRVVAPPPSGAAPSGTVRPGPYAERPGQTYGRRGYATQPPGSGGVIVVPDRGIDPGVERAVRDVIRSQRGAVLACTGSQPVAVRARWGRDGSVWLSLDRPYAGTAIERCVQQSIGAFQVTSGTSGELVHVVQ